MRGTLVGGDVLLAILKSIGRILTDFFQRMSYQCSTDWKLSDGSERHVECARRNAILTRLDQSDKG